MTPIAALTTPAEVRYNKAHKKTRVVVEKWVTVKPRFSNASVLEQIGFRTINSRFLRFRLQTKIRISTKSKEAERTRMRHDAAYVGFFHTIFGVTELLCFFLLLD